MNGRIASSVAVLLVVAAARTPDGRGYWLVESDGTVLGFGGARPLASTRAALPAKPVVAAAAAPDGGYWLASAGGDVTAFGGATFSGSPAASSLHLARPVVAIAATPHGRGYWVACADGVMVVCLPVTCNSFASADAVVSPTTLSITVKAGKLRRITPVM